jgi:hypothetical protein
MPIYLPIVSSGVDILTTQLQNVLYPFVKSKWGVQGVGLADEQYECWGRAQKTWKIDGYMPEITGFTANKEYQDLYPSDKVIVRSFFGLLDPVVGHNRQRDYKVALYFFISDLGAIFPGTTPQRMDEKAIENIANFIDTDMLFGFQVKNIWRDTDKVFSEYSGFAKKDGRNKWNMQPKLCFRIDMVNNNNQDLCDMVYQPIGDRVFSTAFSEVFS